MFSACCVAAQKRLSSRGFRQNWRKNGRHKRLYLLPIHTYAHTLVLTLRVRGRVHFAPALRTTPNGYGCQFFFERRFFLTKQARLSYPQGGRPPHRWSFVASYPGLFDAKSGVRSKIAAPPLTVLACAC